MLLTLFLRASGEEKPTLSLTPSCVVTERFQRSEKNVLLSILGGNAPTLCGRSFTFAPALWNSVPADLRVVTTL